MSTGIRGSDRLRNCSKKSLNILIFNFKYCNNPELNFVFHRFTPFLKLDTSKCFCMYSISRPGGEGNCLHQSIAQYVM